MSSTQALSPTQAQAETTRSGKGNGNHPVVLALLEVGHTRARPLHLLGPCSYTNVHPPVGVNPWVDPTEGIVAREGPATTLLPLLIKQSITRATEPLRKTHAQAQFVCIVSANLRFLIKNQKTAQKALKYVFSVHMQDETSTRL